MVTSLSTISIHTFWHTASSVPTLASKFAGRSETIGFSLDQMNVVYDSVCISIGWWVFDDNKQLGIQNCVLSKWIQFNNFVFRSLLLHECSLEGRCRTSNVLHEHVPGAGQHSWVCTDQPSLCWDVAGMLCHSMNNIEQLDQTQKQTLRYICISILTCSHLLISQSLHWKQNWERLRLAQMESRMLLLTGWQGQIRQKANTYESLVTSRLFFYFAFVQPLIMRNTVRQKTNYSDIRGSMASTCFNSLSCTLEALTTVKNSKEKITGKPHNCWILL